MTTRDEIIAILLEWGSGRLSARDVYAWAERVYHPGTTEFNDWEEGDVSVANEVLGALDLLPLNLMLPEDIPIYLEFLATPRGQFERGFRRFDEALRRIDYESRRRLLTADPFYGQFCGSSRPEEAH
jgi:hypothetical protein